MHLHRPELDIGETMSGIINQVGARSGIISGGGSASAGTVTLAGTTGLDYEEGTFTIANDLQTPATQSCFYTKIGRVVHCSLYIVSGSGGVSLSEWTGLPFVTFNSEGARPGGTTSYQNNDDTDKQYGILLSAGGTNFYFRNPSGTEAIAASKSVFCNITYITT